MKKAYKEKKHTPKWENFSFEDFQKYYEENCKGMSRTEIREKHQNFYYAVRKKGISKRLSF